MSLLERTAEALYLTDTVDVDDPLPYEHISPQLRANYERMAVTALTLAYRESVLVGPESN